MRQNIYLIIITGLSITIAAVLLIQKCSTDNDNSGQENHILAGILLDEERDRTEKQLNEYAEALADSLVFYKNQLKAIKERKDNYKKRKLDQELELNAKIKELEDLKAQATDIIEGIIDYNVGGEDLSVFVEAQKFLEKNDGINITIDTASIASYKEIQGIYENSLDELAKEEKENDLLLSQIDNLKSTNQRLNEVISNLKNQLSSKTSEILDKEKELQQKLLIAQKEKTDLQKRISELEREWEAEKEKVKNILPIAVKRMDLRFISKNDNKTLKLKKGTEYKKRQISHLLVSLSMQKTRLTGDFEETNLYLVVTAPGKDGIMGHEDSEKVVIKGKTFLYSDTSVAL